MTGIYRYFIFCTLILFALSSCQTGGCPNCVNPKPEYYNAAKAREARHMKRHKSSSATGGIVNFEQETKEIKIKSKPSNTKKENKQPPILK